MPADRPAGRATDAEVAETVMGLQEADRGAAQLPLSYFCRFSDGSVIIRQDGGSSTFFKPSTSWESMRLVVERMAALGWDCEMEVYARESIVRFVNEHHRIMEDAETLPHAVCLAALSALAARPAPEGRDGR